MYHFVALFTVTLFSHTIHSAAIPQDNSVGCIQDPDCGPVPGQSPVYVSNQDKSPPFPATVRSPIPATVTGPPGPDDILWQNLLSAEWAIYSFYQQGVAALNQSSFIDLGLPNTTYERITQIRDNEAGHLRIFQDQISPSSLKPGPCEYSFQWETAEEFLALQNLIEVASMAFLTGLAQQATLNKTTGALVAVAETETRHEVSLPIHIDRPIVLYATNHIQTWSLTEVFNIDPFAGPSDTSFPYANEILYTTLADFILPGSCPSENPLYPNPSPNLPQLAYDASTSTGHPGSPITFVFQKNRYTGKTLVPQYVPGKEYFAVFFHGVANVSVPFDTKMNASVIPQAFDAKGIILAVIADEAGAPTAESIVAGPLILLQQPATETNVTAAE